MLVTIAMYIVGDDITLKDDLQSCLFSNRADLLSAVRYAVANVYDLMQPASDAENDGCSTHVFCPEYSCIGLSLTSGGCTLPG